MIKLNMRSYVFMLGLLVTFCSCSISKSSFSPEKKYTLSQVERDYSIYQEILETHHPGLYWYTPKDSMDRYFGIGRSWLKDSMTENDFRKVLTYVTAKIDCGHTTVRASKSYNHYIDTARLGKLFPVSLKIWEDSAVISANLSRRDSILVRGTVIKAIDGHPMQWISDSLFKFISTDGYNRTHKFQTLSNRGYFGSLYTSVFGQRNGYTVNFVDSLGREGLVIVPAYDPARDTFNRAAFRALARSPKPSKKELRDRQYASVRLLQVDSVNHSAMMNLASFTRGFGLKKFFRRSFRTIRKNDITHLIIDVRSNGGGSVSNSTKLTRYLSDHNFKIADTLYAIRKHSPYGKYIQHNFWNRIFISFLTRKHRDGNYHFGYFERHYFKPKSVNHYSGKTYIITGGNSFSATTLFTSALIKQDNVLVVGEETGGGAYGNTAWLIPDATLPETGVRFRLPLFRLVIDHTVPKIGRGVQPEIYSGPTTAAIRRNADYKLEKVMELIRADQPSH